MTHARMRTRETFLRIVLFRREQGKNVTQVSEFRHMSQVRTEPCAPAAESEDRSFIIVPVQEADSKLKVVLGPRNLAQ